MTTIVGIKSSDGVVLASDSLFTADVTKALGSKIFKVNDSIALGISGRMDQMESLFEDLEKKLKDNTYNCKDDFESAVLDVSFALHKRYNLKWSEELGRDIIIFKPESILCVRIGNKKYFLYRLTFNPDPWLIPLKVYDTIGSGQLFANLVLRQQSRPPASDNKTFSDLPLEFNLWIACLTLAEIKAFDRNSGGSTKVALLTENAVRLPPDKSIRGYYNIIVNSISTTFGEKLRTNGDKEEIERLLRDIFPKDE